MPPGARLWMRWLLSRMVKLRGRSTEQIIA
jgi:hypothetical protein